MSNFIVHLYHESGLPVLINSPRDTHLLCLQRLVRMFGYGSTALILVAFLHDLGNPDIRIGVFMTVVLLGDVVISFILTLFADAMGRRNILVVGSALMAFSGVIFALFPNHYWLLLFASTVGVISPSGNEIGPFRAVEESTMAQLCEKSVRSALFAWYNLIGMAGAAFGQLMGGWIVQSLTGKGWTTVGAYRAVFATYALLGLVKTGLSLMLSSQCEVVRKSKEAAKTTSSSSSSPEEMQSLVESEGQGTDQDDSNDTVHKPGANVNSERSPSPAPPRRPPHEKPYLSRLRSFLPPISAKSRATVFRLCLLFVIDSFASGLASASWLSFFIMGKFNVDFHILGTVFFVASLIAALSNLFAASLAKRIGLIKTMVFTHLPSAIFLALIPAPSHFPLAVTLLFLRSCTSTMDAAPRQAFLSQAVLPEERTAVMGVVNLVKTLGQSMGPLVTGFLATRDMFWLAFVLAGSLKATYDLSMLAMFLSFRSPED